MTTMTEIAAALPPVETWPARIRGLPIDERGFPTPWFVAWFRDGKAVAPHTPMAKPDFRVVDTPKWGQAVRGRLCWLCGHPLGKHMAFVIGPMCAINRITSEPPCHRDCAEFAVRTCPFLTRPRMRRNYKDQPEHVGPPGHLIERNPGVAAVWVTQRYSTFKAVHGEHGTLIALGEPEHVAFYAHGREATPDEVRESIESGLPILREVARAQGPEAERELEEDIARWWQAAP
jgi:hypothetical protein